MSGVREGQQQQQQRQRDCQQLPEGAAQGPAKHGPLPEEAQLVRGLQEEEEEEERAAVKNNSWTLYNDATQGQFRPRALDN